VTHLRVHNNRWQNWAPTLNFRDGALERTEALASGASPRQSWTGSAG
jgi:hypothetical protein